MTRYKKFSDGFSTFYYCTHCGFRRFEPPHYICPNCQLIIKEVVE